MFTIVMPTMWRSPHFLKMLPGLNAHPLVSHIFIIDNAPDKCPLLNSHKISRAAFKQNIYVNPAWNIGVREAPTEAICLLSDDVVFDVGVFDFLSDKMGRDKGCVGPFYGPVFEGGISITDKIEPGYGYGTLMFFNKHNYKPIPDQFKIFYGDNWIVLTHKMQGLMPRVLMNFQIKTPMAVTSSSPQFSEQTEAEHAAWKKMFP